MRTWPYPAPITPPLLPRLPNDPNVHHCAHRLYGPAVADPNAQPGQTDASPSGLGIVLLIYCLFVLQRRGAVRDHGSGATVRELLTLYIYIYIYIYVRVCALVFDAVNSFVFPFFVPNTMQYVWHRASLTFHIPSVPWSIFLHVFYFRWCGCNHKGSGVQPSLCWIRDVFGLGHGN